MANESFQTRKDAFYKRRHEDVKRAAHLSPSVTVVSFEGRGNRLTFVYDPLEVRATTHYAGEVVEGVGVIDDASFAPGIISFEGAAKIAQRMFKPFGNTNNQWYEQPQITRDFPREVIADHPRQEKDKVYSVAVL